MELLELLALETVLAHLFVERASWYAERICGDLDVATMFGERHPNQGALHRIELFGQVRTLTAEGRMSGYVLFALPIVVFCGALFLNPDYAGVLLTDPRGKLLLFVAGAMQLMGLAMIRYIINIKV